MGKGRVKGVEMVLFQSKLNLEKEAILLSQFYLEAVDILELREAFEFLEFFFEPFDD